MWVFLFQVTPDYFTSSETTGLDSTTAVSTETTVSSTNTVSTDTESVTTSVDWPSPQERSANAERTTNTFFITCFL